MVSKVVYLSTIGKPLASSHLVVSGNNAEDGSGFIKIPQCNGELAILSPSRGANRPLQMLPSVIFIVLIALIIYAGRTHDEPITSTTSAIAEIWSGHCRQACRHSDNNMAHHDDQVLNSRGAGPSSGCVCSSCPCMLIDNMITTVSPAMACYCHFIEYLSDFILAFARVLSEIINTMVRVLEYRVTYQTNAQGMNEQNLSDTRRYTEERRPYKKGRKEERGIEDTMNENISSTYVKRKSFQDHDRGKKNGKELTGTPSAVSETSNSVAAPPPPRDETKKSHKPETAYDTSAAVEPERREETRTVTKAETRFGASTSLDPESKEVSKTAKKYEKYEASESKAEPERKEEAPKTAKKYEKYEASESKAESDHKEEAPKTAKKHEKYETSESKAEPQRKELPKTAVKQEPKAALELESKPKPLRQESGIKLKPDSKLTLKTESRTKLKSESKTSVKQVSTYNGTKVSEAGTSSMPTKVEDIGTTTSRIEEADSGTTTAQGVCRKCIERGKTCVGGCPRAQLTQLSSERSL